MTLIIKFDDEAENTLRIVLDGLTGYTLRVEYRCTGFPADCAILSAADPDDIIICDVNDEGRPITNSRYHVPYQEIISITII